jgi:RNase P subunit RPR2
MSLIYDEIPDLDEYDVTGREKDYIALNAHFRTPRKVKIRRGIFICPLCNTAFSGRNATLKLDSTPNYCYNCGTRLDWSEKNV